MIPLLLILAVITITLGVRAGDDDRPILGALLIVTSLACWTGVFLGLSA
jgi:hypothetical protein